MFLYFAEGQHASHPAELRYAFEAGVACRAVNNGPSGQAGSVFASSDVERVGYFPDDQTWRQLPKSKCWVGYNNDAVPSANDLKRRQMLDGHLVDLGGQEWLVPVARSWTDELRWTVNLPQSVQINTAGEWEFSGVVPRYRRLWEIGERWFDDAIKYGKKNSEGFLDAAMSVPEAFDLACEALAFNYRVGPAELSMLGVLESGSFVDILNALIDYPRFVELMAVMSGKKKDDSPQDCLNTTDGEQD